MGRRANTEEGSGSQVAQNLSSEELAAKFFEEHPEVENSGVRKVYVTSDGNIFLGNVKGLNLLENYLDSKKSEGISFVEITK